MKKLTIRDRYYILKLRIMAIVGRYHLPTAFRYGLIGIGGAETTGPGGEKLPLSISVAISRVRKGTHPWQQPPQTGAQAQ